VALALRVLFASAPARAQAAPPAPHEDAALDFMNILTDHGMHDLQDESWNIYAQSTYISSWKLPFSAAYTNANGSTNSLVTGAERSFTWTLTEFFGLRLWPGAEVYMVPEIISERPLSNLRGLGGSIQNFELQKTGSETPQLYRAQTFLRQTIGLGGKTVDKTSQPLQLARVDRRRRLVLWAGNFTVLDIFDKNSITGDPRQTFLNMAFMTHAAWDFPADARGYTWGAAAELYWDDLAFRIGRGAPPVNPNALPIDFNIFQHYGDAFELEHDHKVLGQAGAVRLLAYRNSVVTGAFADAIAAFQADPHKNAASCTSYNYGSGNFNAPDLCWVRRLNVKVGIGVDLEQHITSDIGLFFRGMYADGRTEVDAFDSADRSMSFGAVAKGSLWKRPFDVTGVGFGLAWISSIHAQYLAMGGIDGFVGDGALKQAAESVFDVFYSVNLFKAIWLTGDYQFVSNPGFNADRGPVHIFGARAHAEF
jgi:hypothetical protein